MLVLVLILMVALIFAPLQRFQPFNALTRQHRPRETSSFTRLQPSSLFALRGFVSVVQAVGQALPLA
jgi:Protein of unknown function (DUF3433)